MAMNRIHKTDLDSGERIALALRAGDVGLWDWDLGRGMLTYYDPMEGGAFATHCSARVCAREDAVHSDDIPCIMQKLDDHVREQTPFYETEHRLRSDSSEWRWVLCRGKVVEKDKAGKPLRVSGIHVDITARRQAQEEAELHKQQLANAERLASLGYLVSGVAHEINNPNHIIMSFAGILAEVWEGALPILEHYYRENGDFDVGGSPFSELREEMPEMCSKILGNSRRIAAIVERMRAYGREHPPLPSEPEHFNSVVQSALVLLSDQIESSSADISMLYGADLPKIRISYQQIERAVVSLVRNAIESLPAEEHTIVVETSYDDDADEVRLRVQDEGVGMSADTLEHATDPFYTTKRDSGHAGLGLAMVSKIAKEHGGTISFSSETGKGTTALLRLPTVAHPEGLTP